MALFVLGALADLSLSHKVSQSATKNKTPAYFESILAAAARAWLPVVGMGLE